MSKVKITILMPCLNEAETLETCIRKAKKFLKRSTHIGEILIADNGSSDGSQEIVKKNGARLVNVKNKGYGSALIKGIHEAQGEWIIMGDADDSYDFTKIEEFITKLEEGYELVMGNRFKGGIKPGAMPPLHRYLGNPVLSGIGKLFFRSPIGDFHSGLRAFKKSAIEKLDLRTTGMEFASEMVVKATLFDLKITEVPIVLYPDGRSRKPHLHSWRDGWRHLRFLLLYSPKWLFYYPGVFLFCLGSILQLLLINGPVNIYNFNLETNTLILSSLLVVIGFNIISLGAYTEIFAITNKLIPATKSFKIVESKNLLEKGILFGLFILIIGFIGILYLLYSWYSSDFGQLNLLDSSRIAIPSSTLMMVGVQIIFTSFFTSILKLKTIKND